MIENLVKVFLAQTLATLTRLLTPLPHGREDYTLWSRGPYVQLDFKFTEEILKIWNSN
jgi:hypothetical protein